MSDKIFRILIAVLVLLAGIGLLMGVNQTFGVSLFAIVLLVEFRGALNPNISKYNYTKKFFYNVIKKPELYQKIILCLFFYFMAWAIWSLIEPVLQ